MMTANPTAETATTPAYDWREDLDMATDYGSTMSLDAAARVAAYIERLEAEAVPAMRRNLQHAKNNRDNWKARAREAEAERDALRLRVDELSRMVDAGLQVSAERVIRDER